jgi:hypothetical protein
MNRWGSQVFHPKEANYVVDHFACGLDWLPDRVNPDGLCGD